MTGEARSRFGRYLVVGFIGTALHFLTTVALVESALLAPVPASVAGFILTLIVSFILNSRWTFARSQQVWASFLRYVLVSVSGLFLNALLMHGAIEWAGWHYLWGLVLVVLIIPPYNFSLNLLWSFR
ncbi:MAG: GtrA family protein [Pseudomonadota bacterium]